VKLGFVSAILPDLSLEEVVSFAAAERYDCVELMCWPVGKAERRYAGVTHVDVANLDRSGAERIGDLMASSGVAISGLGYYPNPLAPDADEAKVYVNHLQRVICAAELLGVRLVNTFIGRDWTKTVEENWPRFREIWKPLVQFAADHGVRIGIENCPMYFTRDEWPGGKNLAHCPAVWRRMFEEIPSGNFGLNFDPSHLVWQQIDYLKPLVEFAGRIFHVHAKDVRIDRQRLDDVGILATPLEYHHPKLPGLGEVKWGRLLSELGEVGYDGPVCVEVEDRDYEKTLDSRKTALRQSRTFLRQFIPEKAHG
jgi:sugar phosphate isomerase/epimerase